MNVMEARALLFSVIEGGHSFWGQEIGLLGPINVAEKLVNLGYEGVKFDRINSATRKLNVGQVLESIAIANAQFITPEHDHWPVGLKDLAAPPIGLVVKGKSEVLLHSSLAIVGTRNPTNYGVRVAGDFAAGFVDREWAIVSGGVYGIDGAAHKGALIAEGITIAVIATGVDVNYPAGHARLFAEIADSGAIVSEVVPGSHAIPARFLTRNRLIAAISKATLVVEAAFRSGSLRTARDAAELLRPVMAIPGPITSPTSEGCHRLIGERSAEVVTSIVDAVEFIATHR